MVRKPSRRQFGRSVAALTAFGVGESSIVAADNESREDGDFTVQERKKTKTTYKPDTITVETRYTSDDLVHRFGIDSGTITDEIEYDRSEFDGKDTLPKQETDVTVEPWETEMAYEEEWKDYHRDRRQKAEQESNGVSTLDEDPEEHYWSFPVWTYKRNWTMSGFVFEKKSPINVTFDGSSGMSDVTSVLDDNGWTSLDWRQGHEKPRWGYNHTGDDFERSTSWGTSNYRPNGGDHAKLWEFVDGKIGMEVHEDTEIEHTGESRADPEQRILTMYGDEGYNTFEDAWDFDNPKHDHNGKPSVIY